MPLLTLLHHGQDLRSHGSTTQQYSRTIQLGMPTCMKAARPANIAAFPLPSNSLCLQGLM